MFYDLPQELISHIYQFDSTYHNILIKKVHEELKSIKIYKNKNTNMFVMICTNSNMVALSKDFRNPCFVLPFCHWSKKSMRRLLARKVLKCVFPKDYYIESQLSVLYSPNMSFGFPSI